jgi:hypothetical protein
MRSICFVVVALLFGAVDGRSQKRADVTLSDIKGVRLERSMTIDGKARISSDKPVRGLVLFFDFLSADKEVLATEKTLVTEETLKPGADQSFHVDSRFPVGAVRFKMRAYDNYDKELRVGNAGPFVIE